MEGENNENEKEKVKKLRIIIFKLENISWYIIN